MQILKPFFRFWGNVGVAIHRLRFYSGLSALALVGIILAVGLVTSASFFAQAVDQVMLRNEMAEYSRLTGRPPFSARVFASSSQQVPLSMVRAESLGQHVAETLASEIGLPVRKIGMLVNSGILSLNPPPGGAGTGAIQSAEDTNILYIKDVEEQMNILEGNGFGDGTSGEFLESWMHIRQAEEMGVQIGDQFNLSRRGSDALVPLQITGIWQALDPESSFWTSNPDDVLSDKLLVRNADYVTHVEPLLEVKVRSVNWQVVLDEQAVIPANAQRYIDGFDRGEIVIQQYLPDARITVPSISLGKFVNRQTTLTTLLLGFNIPALGFLLYFLILTSAVIAYWQRRDMSILVSRGMSQMGVLNFTLIDGLLLFIIGCPIGLGFGIALAYLMGYTTSFLSFEWRPLLPVSYLGLSIPLVLSTLGIILLAKLWTIATVKQDQVLDVRREHARPSHPPFWYRAYLDFLLIIPTAYAYQQLTNRGSLALLVEETPSDLYRDPLLILVPALFIITMALLSMRVFALFMRLLDKLAHWVPSTVLHLALRQLGRRSHTYINPLLLVIVSLALGIYTLSMAASLDQWLEDRIYYSAGADITFQPFLESDLYAEVTSQASGADWIPLPDEFEALEGVESASRVGDYPTTVRLAARNLPARFLAIDRVDFVETAWFRDDFAPEPLGALMNRLALPEGVLVSQQFLEENNLRIGDKIPLEVRADLGVSFQSQFTITGLYYNFPTVYEDEQTIIGNLDYLSFYYGLTMPHNIWLRTGDGADGKAVLDQVPDLDIITLDRHDAQAAVVEQKSQMERVGVFGTLSVSFIAAAIMAAIGLMTYSYASLEERRFYFALLRAGGLGQRQVIAQVIWEYGILTAFGAVAGVISGTIAAQLFVPLFRVSGEAQVPLPPLLPIIAKEEVIPLAVGFAAVMIFLEVVLIVSALRRRLFESLRLGG